MNGLERPSILLLVLLPLLWPVLQTLLTGRRRRKLPGLPLPLDVWRGNQMPDASLPSRLAYYGSILASLAAWTLLGLALAGPYRLQTSLQAVGRNTDVMFVIDISPSMAALDLRPSRLGAALELVRDYVASRPDVAIGLTAFGADVALVCPPTPDHAAVLQRLDLLKPGQFGDGTAIGGALANALAHLQVSAGRHKALVLLSDGEDNVGRVHPADVVALAAENGVSLAVFGLGTKGMVSVDYVDPFTGERRRGNYQSDFDEAALRAVAGAGAGYFALADSSGNLASLQRWLRVSQPAAVAAVSQVTLRQSLASGFFLLACLLALAAWLARAVWFGGVV